MQALARDLILLKAARSVEDLNRVYRRLCKQYHPDLRVLEEREQSEQQMRLINAAYHENLRRFNIFTQRSFQAAPHRPGSHQRSPSATASVSVSVSAPPPPSRSTRAESRGSGFSPGAVRGLARAMATLKKTGCFFSLRSTDDPREKDLLVQGIEELQQVIERHGGREGREALYYQAVALCNLRAYKLALRLLDQYAERYPGETADGAFHFYRGLLAHRLGQFEAAQREYLFFLHGANGGQYKHFAALVASFLEAARLGCIPPNLPYA